MRFPAAVTAAVAPTPERYQHSPVALCDHEIRDSDDWLSMPYKAVDTLGRLLGNGTITAREHRAGTRFRNTFHRAHLNPLRCADLGRPRVDDAPRFDLGACAYEARDEIDGCMRHLGSPANSCAWYVLGFEMSLSEWAMRISAAGVRCLDRETARGVLIGLLGSLANHFFGPERDDGGARS